MEPFLRLRFLRAAFLSLLFMAFNLSFGQSLWTNPIDANAPGTQNPYTTGDVKAPNLTVSGIGRGSGITGNAGTGRYNTTGWATSGSSVNADEYFTFTLTPGTGYKINFTGFEFTLQRSTTGPTTFVVKSSLDNYTATIETATPSGITAFAKTVSLSGAAFQNITSAITFRVYGYNASGATGTASINDFTFNGVMNSLGSEDHLPVPPAFAVYPNPVAGGTVYFNIAADITVYDSLGKLLLSQKETTSLDTTGFTAGIYFIKTAEGDLQRLLVQ